MGSEMCIRDSINMESNNLFEQESKECVIQKAGITERDSSSSLAKAVVNNEVIQPKFGRQKSLQTVVVRKTQVEDALENWKEIVEFCKEVRL